jgi:hypothetical protein
MRGYDASRRIHYFEPLGDAEMDASSRVAWCRRSYGSDAVPVGMDHAAWFAWLKCGGFRAEPTDQPDVQG